MDQKIGWIAKRVLPAVGLTLVLGIQACEDNKITEQAPGKAIESAASTPAAERRETASASGENAADGTNRESGPAGGSK